VKFLDKKAEKSRISNKLSGGRSESTRKLMLSTNVRRPETKYKRSKIAFAVTSIAFTVVHICIELLQLPAQPLIESPGNLTRLGQITSRIVLTKKMRGHEEGTGTPY